jgi:hypothetical protein
VSGNTGAAIGRIAVTAIASYYGGPIAGAVAGAAFGVVFPVVNESEGPRIGDAPGLPSTVGSAISLSYGTTPIAGVCIWASDYTEHAKEQSGKGGSEQKIKNYSYTRSYAMMFGGRPKQGLILLKRNGKIVLDARAQFDGESDEEFRKRRIVAAGFRTRNEIYYGTDTQLPSPTIEASKGIGNVPAYRTRPYIVLVDEDVTDTNTLPAAWEGVWADSAVEVLDETTEYKNDVLEAWSDGATSDPRSCLNDHEYRYAANAWTDDFDAAKDQALAATSWWNGENDVQRGWSATATGSSPDFSATMGPYQSEDSGNRSTVFIHFNMSSIAPGFTAGYKGLTSSVVLGRSADDDAFEETAFLSVASMVSFINDAHPVGSVMYSDTQSCPGPTPIYYHVSSYVPGGNNAFSLVQFVLSDPAGTCGAFGPYENGEYFADATPDALIQVRRKIRAPANLCAPRCLPPYPLFDSNPTYCVVDTAQMGQLDFPVLQRNIDYVQVAGSFLALSNFSKTDNDAAPYTTAAILYPNDPVILVTSPSNTQAFWDAAYADAVAAGRIPAGYTYDAEGNGPGLNYYPIQKAYAWVREDSLMHLVDSPVSMGSIVTELCQRSGLSSADINTDDLDLIDVKGYLIGRSGVTARQGIEQLRAFGRFEIVESALMKFPVRGKPSVRGFILDDLGAHYAGEQTPEPITTEDTEDIELPKTVRFTCLIPARNWAAGMQQAQRQVTRSVVQSDIQCPISLTDTEAATVALYWLLDAYDGRVQFSFSIGPENLDLEPGDCVDVPFGSDFDRVRIESIQMAAPGVMRISARREGLSTFTVTQEGVSVPASIPVTTSVTPASLVPLDIPALVSSDDNSGYYMAVYGSLTGYQGASVLRSTNGGTTFIQAVDAPSESSVGVVSTVPSTVDPFRIDLTNTLTVQMIRGSLSSITHNELLSGSNAFAWQIRGQDGLTSNWEICQFQTATLIGTDQYEISTLTRGRKGTEDFIDDHQSGDLFVLLSAPINRIIGDDSLIGVEVQHKAVAFGTLDDSAVAVDFTPSAVSLRCYSPCLVRGYRNDDGDLIITWVPRSRLGGTRWLDGFPVPFGEQSESYSVDILQNGVAVRSITATSRTATYTATQQLLDFAELQVSVDVVAYQINAIIGRGEPEEATL